MQTNQITGTEKNSMQLTRALQSIVMVVIYALALALMFTGNVYAQQEVVVDTIPTQITDWEDSLEFPKFDQNKGILQSITLTLTSVVSGSAAYENRSPVTNVVTLTHRAKIDIFLFGAPVGELTPTAGIRLDLPAYDGDGGFDSDPITFTAPSGGETTMQGSAGQILQFTQAEQLAAFIGQGTITIPVTAEAIGVSGDSTGNIDFLLRTNSAGLHAELTYNYAVPSIRIRKFVNGNDANDPRGDDVPRVAIGQPLVWTYHVTNTSQIPLLRAQVVVTDSLPGIVPILILTSDVGNDGILSPGEVWHYTSSGSALNVKERSLGITVIDGCPFDGEMRPTDQDSAMVTIPGATDSDIAHYCNVWADIKIETTVYKNLDCCEFPE